MRKFEDTYQHKGLRKKLVNTLREKGITDENVLQAIENIPRHFFLDSAFDKMAYDWLSLADRLSVSVEELHQTIGYSKTRMQEFEADGLIEYDQDKLIITSEGRLFVRNVAASMDLLVRNSDKVFSKPV